MVYNIQQTVYLNNELYHEIEKQPEPNSEFIRYSIRQELQRRSEE